MYTGTREPVNSGTPPQTPSLVSNGFLMVRSPVSFFTVWQESVRQDRQKIVANVLARYLRITGNELSCSLPLDGYPVYEIVDFYISAAEDRHLARRRVLQRVRSVSVMHHESYYSKT